jgi:hypothetical protein
MKYLKSSNNYFLKETIIGLAIKSMLPKFRISEKINSFRYYLYTKHVGINSYFNDDK